MTYAYLAGWKEKDTKLEALKVEGLKIMVMHQLKMIMPQKCKDSNDIFYPLPGERIEIGCIKCKRMAYPRCYNMNPAVVRLKYVCSLCIEVLDREQWYKSLTEEL